MGCAVAAKPSVPRATMRRLRRTVLRNYAGGCRPVGTAALESWIQDELLRSASATRRCRRSLVRVATFANGVHGGDDIVIGRAVRETGVRKARACRRANRAVRAAAYGSALHVVARRSTASGPGQRDLSIAGGSGQSRRSGRNRSSSAALGGDEAVPVNRAPACAVIPTRVGGRTGSIWQGAVAAGCNVKPYIASTVLGVDEVLNATHSLLTGAIWRQAAVGDDLLLSGR